MYVVYEHYYNDKIIYVGSGTLKRAHRKGRNKKYSEMCNGCLQDVEVKIVKHFNDREEAFQYEEGLTRWYFEENIELSNVFTGRKGYGIANGFYSKKHKIETKQTIGRKNAEWMKVNKEKFIKIMNDKRNDEWRNKISKRKQGVKLSDSHRLAISNGTKGKNNPMYGKNHSELSMKNMVKNRKDFAKIVVENVENGEIYRFDSANQAAKKFNLKPYMITRKTKNNNVYIINNLKVWREN